MISHSHIKIPTNKNQSLFEQIYQAAKANNHAWFDKATVYPIDVREGMYTPASKLAKENQYSAVLLLIKHGASVHEAGMGAAAGNNKILAEELRKYYGASANYIAKGAAIAGNKQYVEELMNVHGAIFTWVVKGGAIKGDFEYVEELSKTYQSDIIHKNKFDSLIAKNAIIGGNAEYVLKQLNLNLHINKIMEGLVITGNLQYIEQLTKEYKVRNFYSAKCAAYIGDIEYCLNLKKDEKWNTDENYQLSINLGIAEGWLASGNIAVFNNFNIDDLDLDTIWIDVFTEACIKYGMSNILLKNNKTNLFEKEFIKAIFEHNTTTITNATKYGRIEIPIYCYNKISIMKEKRKSQLLINTHTGMKNSDLFKNSKLALHQLSFIEDHEFLKDLYDSFGFSYIKDTIPMAMKINSTMKRYHLDFDQAQALLNQKKELQLLLLHFPFGFFRTLPTDIHLNILMYVISLPFENARDLYNKVSFPLHQAFFKFDIKKYTADSSADHKNRAKSILKASQKIEKKSDLSALIRYQKDLFDGVEKPEKNKNKPKHEQPLGKKGKDGFYEIIVKHGNRMG